jgi:hypothetical protein
MTDSVIINMSGIGEVRAKNLGNGIVSWECPKRRSGGMTDVPTGWYKLRANWNARDKETWGAFLSEVRDCIQAEYPWLDMA